MVALVGVIATALSLILFIVFCVTYTFKAKKCCFKHKGPAFERDTNFRIYPNDHYIVSRFLTSCTRGIHKLRLQDLVFLTTYLVHTPLRLHFLWYKSLQKIDFFDHLPLSSCKRIL